MTNYAEKRKYVRKKACWPVVITSDQERIWGETRNISAGGAFICCEEELFFDRDYYISMTSPTGSQIETMVKVVWSNLFCVYKNEPGSGMGIQFGILPPEISQYIEDLEVSPAD